MGGREGAREEDGREAQKERTWQDTDVECELGSYTDG